MVDVQGCKVMLKELNGQFKKQNEKHFTNNLSEIYKK
jgi:hypothetical protein